MDKIKNLNITLVLLYMIYLIILFILLPAGYAAPQRVRFGGRVPRRGAGAEPLKIIPALTTCASKQMKTHRFRTLRVLPPGANARGKAREKLEKVAVCHFFDTQRISKFFVLLSQHLA